MDWLHRYERFWSDRLNRLSRFLEEDKSWPPQHSHQAKPHPQAPVQSAAGQSLRRLHRPAKDSALVRAAGRRPMSSAETDLRDRRPLSHRCARARRHTRGQRRLSRDRAEREAGLHLGVEEHAGARIDGYRLLKPDGDGTLLTLIHEQFFDEDARDRHQQGWTGALDKLEKLFA